MRPKFFAAFLVLSLISLSVPFVSKAAATNDSFVINEEEFFVVAASDLLANDTDPQNLPLEIISVGNPINGTVDFDGTNVNFVPDQDFVGSASFEYTNSNSNGDSSIGVVNFDVLTVQDPPTLFPPDPVTAPLNTPISIIILATDPDGDLLTFNLIDSFFGNVPDGATIDLETGEFTWIPTQLGTFTITVSVVDIDENDAVGFFDITVVEATDQPGPPVANPDSLSMNEGGLLSIPANDLLANDTGPAGFPLEIISVGNAVNGNVNFDGSNVAFDNDANPDFFGTASFEYIVSNSAGTDTGLVTVDILPNQDPPSINPIDPMTVTVNTPINFFVQASDPDGDLLIFLLTDFPPAAMNPDTGEFNWTPTEEGVFSLTVRVVDIAENDASQTFEVTVLPAPPPPPPSPVPSDLIILSPADSGLVNGLVQVEALVSELDINSYNMGWRTDPTGAFVPMFNDPTNTFKRNLIDFISWTWRTDNTYPLEFRATDLSGATLFTKTIHVIHSNTPPPPPPPQAENDLVVLAPADNGAVNGVVEVQALVNGADINSYNIGWRTDPAGAFVPMSNDPTNTFKRNLIDFTSWTWRTDNTYPLEFRATDLSGTVLFSKTIHVINSATPPPPPPDETSDLIIMAPVNNLVVSGLVEIKAKVNGADINSYNIGWRTDPAGAFVPMSNDPTNSFKRNFIDFTSWNWRTDNTYPLEFRATDTSGTVLFSKTIHVIH